MNNATWESLLAMLFIFLAIVIPFVIIAMIWPVWLGDHITLFGKWLDHVLYEALAKTQ